MCVYLRDSYYFSITESRVPDDYRLGVCTPQHCIFRVSALKLRGWGKKLPVENSENSPVSPRSFHMWTQGCSVQLHWTGNIASVLCRDICPCCNGSEWQVHVIATMSSVIYPSFSQTPTYCIIGEWSRSSSAVYEFTWSYLQNLNPTQSWGEGPRILRVLIWPLLTYSAIAERLIVHIYVFARVYKDTASGSFVFHTYALKVTHFKYSREIVPTPSRQSLGAWPLHYV